MFHHKLKKLSRRGDNSRFILILDIGNKFISDNRSHILEIHHNPEKKKEIKIFFSNDSNWRLLLMSDYI